MKAPSAARSVASILAASALLAASGASPAQQAVIGLHSQFVTPPEDARPMMRWWWFGPAVVKPELDRELEQMHAAGIGGVEIAAEYPLALDEPAKGLVNLRYGSPEYVDMVRFAAEKAHSLGMRVDVTMGSGWPFGGPHIPINLAAGRLKVVPVALGPAASLPKLAEGESLIAAFVTHGTPDKWDAATARQVANAAMPSALEASSANTPQVEVFFVASHTRQQVKRAAFGSEGYVLDHMEKGAIEQHQRTVGDALLRAFPQRPPYALFSDSLEVYGSDWTANLPAEFQRRRGYDLIPHLPELAMGRTPQAESVRRDWGQTLAELVHDNYLQPMAQYAAAHGTKFRSQTYGEPPVTLADELVPQLPEGEGPQWHAFSFTRWASSANHIAGNRVTSAETWTWLHSPAFRATPLDMKQEADRMFLEGVNQIIGHGFPYSAPGVPEPGWSLYAAAALNDHNPWWPVMPAVTRYLQRVSWALRQGEPANDIALLLPEADAQASFHPAVGRSPDNASVTGEMTRRITPELMGAMLDNGYNVDFVDVPAMRAHPLHHPLLVVAPTQRIPLAGVEALESYAAKGGKLIFVGAVPTRAAGLADAADSPSVASRIAALVARSLHVDNFSALPGALKQALAPDVGLGTAGGKVGFLHRHLPDADLYFLANTTPEAQTFPLHVRAQRTSAEWWDLDSGAATAAQSGESLTLPPYGSRLLMLHDGASTAARPRILHAGQRPAIVLSDWTLTFPGSAGSRPAPSVTHARTTLWNELEATKFYSGEVRYTARFEAKRPAAGERMVLRFADSVPLPDTQAPNKPGTRAWIDAPIHEAALVTVNGKDAGALWHPPYELDVTAAVKPGSNTIEISVFNTAINELAGQPPRDYTALKAKYGDRFQMQDMNDLQPQSSGLRGPVRLEIESEGR